MARLWKPQYRKKDSAQNSQTEKPFDEKASEKLVVCFSCTGTTKAAAEKIAVITGADLYEIVPKEPYTAEDLDYSNNNCRANIEMNDQTARPEINGEALDLSLYHTIFIGYPIWWGTMPRILNTFLDTYNLSGKTVTPFCTSSGSSISQSVSVLKKEEPSADIRNGIRVDNADDSQIYTWLENNDIK